MFRSLIIQVLLVGLSLSSTLVRADSRTVTPNLVFQRGHSGFIRDLDFSLDGRLLATASDDSSIRIWDVSNARELRQISQGLPIKRVRFSPDGHLVAALSFQKLIVWDLLTGARVAFFSYYDSSPVYPGGVTFSADGKEVVVADGSRVFKWKIDQSSHRVDPFSYTITCFSAAARNDVIAVCQKDNVILWNTSTNKVEGTIGPVIPFAPAPEVVEARKKWAESMKQFGEQTAAIYQSSDDAFVLSVALAPEWHCLLTVHYDGSVRAWNLDSGKQVFAQRTDPNGAGIDGIDIDPKAPIVADSSGDEIELRDLVSGEVIHQMAPPDPKHIGTIAPLYSRTYGKIAPIRFSPDGAILAQGRVLENRIVFWNSNSRSVRGLTQTAVGVMDTRISRDGRWLATVTGLNPAVWDLKTGQEIEVGDSVKNDVFNVGVSEDSSSIAWVGNTEIRVQHLDGSFETEHVISGCGSQQEHQLCTNENSTLDFMAFSSDDQRLFAREKQPPFVSNAQPLASFFEINLADGKVIKPLAIPVQGAITATFSPSGGLLALAEFADTASILRGSVMAKPTRTVRLWDWNSGKELPSLSFSIISEDQVRQFILAKPLPNPEGFNDDLPKIRVNQARGVRDSEQVAKILFSPDGRKLAAAYGYHGVVIWNLDNREMLVQTGPTLGDNGQLYFPLELAFSPDGKSLAAGWNNGDLGIIDLDTRKEMARWSGHDGPVTSLAF